MLVLIDESGDPGFKLERGSSPYFVAAMVVFKDFAEAEKCGVAIAALQKKLHIYPEFKFSNCSADVRDQFFDCVSCFDFAVYTIIVPKATIYSSKLRNDCASFYNYFVRQLLSFHHTLLVNATIKIDESGDRRFKRELADYINRMMPDGCIKGRVKFKRSRNDHLIQMADMVVGAISRLYSAKKDNSRWHAKIARKIKNSWIFE